jgi:hypothetical protein
MTRSSCGEIDLTTLMEGFQKMTWGANQVHRRKSEKFLSRVMPVSRDPFLRHRTCETRVCRVLEGQITHSPPPPMSLPQRR